MEQIHSLKQWGFGSPDVTIAAFKQYIGQLNKVLTNQSDANLKKLFVLEGSTIDLYKLIPQLYIQHFKNNDIKIKGISLNQYYTAHPYFEKINGIVPFVYYNFRVLRSYFQNVMNKQSISIDHDRKDDNIKDDNKDEDENENKNALKVNMNENNVFAFANIIECPKQANGNCFLNINNILLMNILSNGKKIACLALVLTFIIMILKNENNLPNVNEII